MTNVVAWMISCLMHNFEYKRALGHTWYLHPLFWLASLAFYSLTLFYHYKLMDLTDPLMMLNCFQIVATLSLCVSYCVYSYDTLYSRRTYMKVKNLNSSLTWTSSLLSKTEPSETDSLYSVTSDKIRFKTFPIIVAKVTSSMCIENGQILYEIIAKTKRDEFSVSVKRSFKEFQYLDKTLERKYG